MMNPSAPPGFTPPARPSSRSPKLAPYLSQFSCENLDLISLLGIIQQAKKAGEETAHPEMRASAGKRRERVSKR
jgi:hypothetical protein